MNIEDISDILSNQFNSVKDLPVYERNISLVQTLRMTLFMLKSTLDIKYSKNKQSVQSLIILMDKCLHIMLPDISLTCSPLIKSENFSEDNKEDSDWASPLSNSKSDKNNTENFLWNEENKVPINEIFYIGEEDEIDVGEVSDEKYYDFLIKLAKKNIHTKTPNKLHFLLEMYKDTEPKKLAFLKHHTLFKLIFENKCEEYLIEYLSQD